MDPTRFIHIRSDKLRPLPGEEEEHINEGTYGKAVAQHLQTALKARSFDIGFVCCEDWGWWVDISDQPYELGILVYGTIETPTDHEYCMTLSAGPGRRWSWRKFKVLDITAQVNDLFTALQDIVENDDDIEVIDYSDDYPL